MILADTDVLIDYLAAVQPVKDQIARYADAEQLQTTAASPPSGRKTGLNSTG